MPPEFLTYRQLATELNVPLGTLYGWVARHQVPHIRVGKRLVRFERNAIAAFVRERTVSVAEITARRSR